MKRVKQRTSSPRSSRRRNADRVAWARNLGHTRSEASQVSGRSPDSVDVIRASAASPGTRRRSAPNRLDLWFGETLRSSAGPATRIHCVMSSIHLASLKISRSDAL
eukprot:scaffold529_cov308-Pinguiococcus_pyrenoidosus.AAC.81